VVTSELEVTMVLQGYRENVTWKVFLLQFPLFSMGFQDCLCLMKRERRINTAADLLHCNHAWPPFAYAYTGATKYLGHAGTITTAD